MEAIQGRGGAFALECRGADSGNRWLNGDTIHGRIGLAPSTARPFTGTRWQIKPASGGYSLKCLGEVEGPATAPPNGNVAPPGPYMVFVVDRDNRPCQYARFAEVRDLPDDGSRYASIWAKADEGPFVARHGMSSAQYQKEFDELVGKQGFRLTLIHGHTVAGRDQYSAIWERRASPAWVARHGLNSADYQKEFDDNVRQGFRLTVVSGYEVAGQARYAAIWDKSDGPAWQPRHGLTPKQYQDTFNELVAQGFRLELVNGYSVAGQEFFAAIWKKSDGTPFIARHGLTSAQYQDEFDTNVRNGFRLTWVSCYRHVSQKRYAAIWDKSHRPLGSRDMA